MSRGRKAVVNYDDEITKIDAQIDKNKSLILELQDKRKELLQQKERSEMEALYLAVKSTGRPINEIVEVIQGCRPDGGAS